MFPKKGNKLHPKRHPNGAAISFNLTIAAALRAELGSTHQATKTVIRWTGASERTVKHWFAGTHGPSGDHLVQLMANSDGVLKVLLVRAGRRGSLSGAKVIEIQNYLMGALKCLEIED